TRQLRRRQFQKAAHNLERGFHPHRNQGDPEDDMVNMKELLAAACPSDTRIVITAVPVWPRAGVTVTVRLEPLPPKTMLPFGTKRVSDEVPVRGRLDGAVSTSPI